MSLVSVRIAGSALGCTYPATKEPNKHKDSLEVFISAKDVMIECVILF
jgi:hypothetical protein